MDSVKGIIAMAGYRTGLANPGKWIPEITEPVVAISLEGVDSETYEVTVRSEVVSPVMLGGKRCEEEVLKVLSILQNRGARCEVTALKFDAKTELFSMAVLSTFHGDILDDDWDFEKSCTVDWGGITIGTPVAFNAWRETNDPETPLSLTKWHFRMEETLTGKWPEVNMSDPFTITVTAGNITDTYTGCTVTRQQRYLQEGHLRQIREGTATGKE